MARPDEVVPGILLNKSGFHCVGSERREYQAHSRLVRLRREHPARRAKAGLLRVQIRVCSGELLAWVLQNPMVMDGQHTKENDEMGRLTTHVLDTMRGGPAAGLGVVLHRMHGSVAVALKSLTLNADGRADGPLLEDAALVAGRYRLVFAVGRYFAQAGVPLPDPPFLDDVPVDFGIADPQAHYHVPLLVSPWSYSTYRGS